MRAALLSLKGAPRLHGVASLCVDDETTEPPAHCRLVSSHDLFKMVASPDCIGLLRAFLMRRSGDNASAPSVHGRARHSERGEREPPLFGSFLVVRQERHSPRSRQVFARAPGRGGQSCRRHPQGLALTAAGERARQSEAQIVAVATVFG